jgi:hypothetical protein
MIVYQLYAFCVDPHLFRDFSPKLPQKYQIRFSFQSLEDSSALSTNAKKEFTRAEIKS